jgi:Kef-type K+ transport system membrane component KefB
LQWPDLWPTVSTIVGAFLAGLAVNAAAERHPAREKLEFFGKSLFIPCFFIATGFLIDPLNFLNTIRDHFLLVLAIISALLVGKGIAAEVAGRKFAYTSGLSRCRRSLLRWRRPWLVTTPSIRRVSVCWRSRC